MRLPEAAPGQSVALGDNRRDPLTGGGTGKRPKLAMIDRRPRHLLPRYAFRDRPGLVPGGQKETALVSENRRGGVHHARIWSREVSERWPVIAPPAALCKRYGPIRTATVGTGLFHLAEGVRSKWPRRPLPDCGRAYRRGRLTEQDSTLEIAEYTATRPFGSPP